MKNRILSLILIILLLVSLTVVLVVLAVRNVHKEEAVEPTPTADPYEGLVLVPDGSGGTMWVAEATELTPFALDADAFSVTDGIASYSGDDATLVLGVDVSEHQGSIDWQAVADAGIEFAIIRCGWRGYSGGSLNTDSLFQENVEGALAAGLDVGVYFFSQAVSVVEAAEEAILTLELIDGYDISLPVFFDWDTIGTGESARTDNVNANTVTEACLEFCQLIESEGYEAGVYAYLNLAYFTYDLNQLKDLTIWMGNPGSQPEFYYEHTYWQYSFTGSVDGIEGDVDMDVMYVRTDSTQTDEDAQAVEPEETAEAAVTADTTTSDADGGEAEN
ncbi:MAG: glycoside hydrolase family 25 protein [Oscillospiraceae bacterium]|nr:glycoside hydrolase family 25 protein [Oscillospiraceae bacterium]